jgi:hypothetical protein
VLFTSPRLKRSGNALERRVSETFPDHLRDDWGGLKLSSAVEMLRNERDWDHPTLKRLDYWGELVGHYSNADLTFRTKDKLVAISGLARAIGPSSEYVAGLWKPELACGLEWVTGKRQGQRTSRAPEYRAPTWS